MNLETALKTAIATGKVDIGSNSTSRNARDGKGRLIILAANIDAVLRADIENHAKLGAIPVYIYQGPSTELGSMCKKPFPVAAMTIHEAGDSDILDVTKKQGKE